jgi:hypothetical protein
MPYSCLNEQIQEKAARVGLNYSSSLMTTKQSPQKSASSLIQSWLI